MPLDNDLPTGLLPDWAIRHLAVYDSMISPFHNKSIRSVEKQVAEELVQTKVMSYGSSSFGYDLRLSDSELYLIAPRGGNYVDIIDPKNFSGSVLAKADLHVDETGSYFVIPPNSSSLGTIIEELHLPSDVTATFYGKSSYARAGVHLNVTPGEAGWKGHLTVNICNANASAVKVYANEGILQALFWRSEKCETDYEKRGGKYQNQTASVTATKM